MKSKKLFLGVIILVAVYVASYLVFRRLHVQTWEEDGKDYLIFPKNYVWTYHLYRPLCYVDGAMTDMRFHIGPHQ
jgi:hypothetical protein